jgi:hypothetical protein
MAIIVVGVVALASSEGHTRLKGTCEPGVAG